MGLEFFEVDVTAGFRFLKPRPAASDTFDDDDDDDDGLKHLKKADKRAMHALIYIPQIIYEVLEFTMRNLHNYDAMQAIYIYRWIQTMFKRLAWLLALLEYSNEVSKYYTFQAFYI